MLMDPKCAVEAALFSASRPLRVRDIAERTGLEDTQVREALKSLKQEYDDRGSAIRISKIGSEIVMRLRDEYSEYTDQFTDAELGRGLMKTLVAIAYHQPIMQSELSKKIGSRVYDDVPALIEKGFVNGKKIGNSKELTVTKKFMEYFGVEGTRKEDIRRWLDSQQLS